MNRRELLSISFKILGVGSLMYGVTSIPHVAIAISSVFRESGEHFNPYVYLGVTLATPILLLGMAYVLLKWGDLIAEKLIREDRLISSLGSSDWERAAFGLSLRIVGVVCFIRGIPELVKVLARFGFRGEFRSIIRSSAWSGTLGGLVVLIIGGYLISGGKHLVRLALGEGKTSADKSE